MKFKIVHPENSEEAPKEDIWELKLGIDAHCSEPYPVLYYRKKGETKEYHHDGWRSFAYLGLHEESFHVFKKDLKNMGLRLTSSPQEEL